MIKMEKQDEESVRSEMVRDYLEKMPHWIIRVGMYIIGGILTLLIALSLIVHYPTLVTAELRLTSKLTNKPVVVREDGRLEKLFVVESERVNKGQVLGWMQSNAIHQEVLDLESELVIMSDLIQREKYDSVTQLSLSQFKSLGEIQTVYQSFQSNLIQIMSLYGTDFYRRKRKILMDDIGELDRVRKALNDQLAFYQRDLELGNKEFEMNKNLYNDKVISSLDLDREESKALAKKISLQDIEFSITENNSLRLSKQRDFLDLEKMLFEQTKELEQSLNVLNSSIVAWKNRFLLTAPTSGIVRFPELLQESQHLKVNTELCFIGEKQGDFFGAIRIPQSNFGKVKVDQKVLIKFNGFPYEEFGSLDGKIQSIASIPNIEGDKFYATVSLPESLLTNQGKSLEFKDGMLGTAEIVTEDMSLAQRIFYDIKRIISSR